jgi:uncharacterized protein (TIGR02145 family)
MSKVNGKDAILYKYNETTLDWVPFGCARSITLDISREMVETSITGNGVFKTYVPGAGSVSGTIEGLVFISLDSPTLITMKEVYDLIINGTTFNIKYYERDFTFQTYLQKELTVLLESLNETASFDNMVTFSANFRGVGAPIVKMGNPAISTTQIGTQIWTTLNFREVLYLNGDFIPYAANATEWTDYADSSTGAWCYYNFDPVNSSYGKLYNWFAINDSRGFGYEGFHIPTEAEWTDLKSAVSGDGLKLKESGTTHWLTDNGTDDYLFGAKGNGDVNNTGDSENLKEFAYYWTSDEDGAPYGKSYFILDDGGITNSSYEKGYGMSVRLIED